MVMLKFSTLWKSTILIQILIVELTIIQIQVSLLENVKSGDKFQIFRELRLEALILQKISPRSHFPLVFL